MAVAQLKPATPQVVGPNEKEKKLLKRVERARRDRQKHQSRLADCYKYAMPWRHKFNQSGETGAVVDLDEIFDSTLMTVLEDFAADMLNTFTPIKNDWVSFKPVETLDVAEKRQLETPLAEYQRIIFSEMARSNLYQAMEESYKDLGPGTMAMKIDDIDPAKPIHCEAVPVTELLLDRGPYGTVDKWREWKCRAEDVPVYWPSAKPLHEVGVSTDCTEVDIIDGVYRDWDDRTSEVYRYAVLANQRIIWEKEYRGQGSCAYVVARWSRDSTTAWGVGPTYRSMPDNKTLQHVKYVELKNHDKYADPVVSYVDDGVIDPSAGIDPGTWIPRAQDSEAPTVIEPKVSLDRTVFQLDELQSAIKRAHYQDRPEQAGKTPPTATQWADEAAERARRMGTPATNLVIEWQYPIVQRFAYLLAQRGVLPKVELNGKQIALEPISPLLRAQEQEEVIRLDRFAEMIGARFGPQIANVVINQIKYAHRLAKLLGVDPGLLRDENEITKAIQQFAPVIQRAGGVGDVPPSAATGAV